MYFVVVIQFAGGNQFLLLIEIIKVTETCSLFCPQGSMKAALYLPISGKIFNVFIGCVAVLEQPAVRGGEAWEPTRRL